MEGKDVDQIMTVGVKEFVVPLVVVVTEGVALFNFFIKIYNNCLTDGLDLKSKPSVNFGSRIKIYCYRRSLQDCINSLIENGFSISKLIEPKPVKEFKNLDPKHYEELNQFPAFMCIKAKNN